MIVHNREVNFRATVGAMAEIADLCPGGSLGNLGKLIEGKAEGEVFRGIAQIIAILNRGDCDARKYEGLPAADPLTVNEILTLEKDEFAALEKQALAVIYADNTPTVEIETPKNAEAGENPLPG